MPSSDPDDPGQLSVTTPQDVRDCLLQEDYLADEALVSAVFLAVRLQRPLLLEGDPGVGKTEVARALARGLGREFIRLQCFEGLGLADAVYEWNHARQIMAVRLAEIGGEAAGVSEESVYSERFLLRRPVLRALEGRPGRAPVLLIDEIDRADAPFEAFLLEVLADFQVTIPEFGIVRAQEPPIVVLTSNRTRDVHDALKRRALYHWVDHPDPERELAILARKVPDADAVLAAEVVRFAHRLRTMDLQKPPGIAESIDWLRALILLGCTRLDARTITLSLGALLKSQEDVAAVRAIPWGDLLASGQP
ncbi:MAG: AAA family ATPase [Betaproteobacteria bacterium]|nr:AAA family ATPase [Betaproteobacteria bacterium]